MHTGKITIKEFTKVEGAAGLEVDIKEDKVVDAKLIFTDCRRFYTVTIKGKPAETAPQVMSRICGTCSVSHLLSSIQGIEEIYGIQISEQTRTLRKLAYDALLIRDHPLHLYFFALPDLLGVDSILDVSDDPNDFGYVLLHDSYDIKRVGTALSFATMGAPIHAPWPVVGGFDQLPDDSKFPEFIAQLEKIRPQMLRGVKAFAEWDRKFERNQNYIALRGAKDFNYLEGEVVSSMGDKFAQKDFYNMVKRFPRRDSNTEGYKLMADGGDFLVGALARLNLNKDQIHPRTAEDCKEYLDRFPSNNLYDNNVAQAIETVQAIDEAIDIMKELKIQPEKPAPLSPKAGRSVSVVEAPRGTLTHTLETDDQGLVTDYFVTAPTAHNQVNIEHDMLQLFQEHYGKKTPDEMIHMAEEVMRTYDPCISCSTNFLKITYNQV